MLHTVLDLVLSKACDAISADARRRRSQKSWVPFDFRVISLRVVLYRLDDDYQSTVDYRYHDVDKMY